MSYYYEEHRHFLFTEEGQLMFLKVRDHTRQLLEKAGAARLQEMISTVTCGDSWSMMACVDRLVELKEIREVTPPKSTAGQHRVFVSNFFHA